MLVAGIFKEILTLTVACLFGHESLTPINILGLIVSMGGIGYYNYMKYQCAATGKRRSGLLRLRLWLFVLCRQSKGPQYEAVPQHESSSTAALAPSPTSSRSSHKAVAESHF